MCNETSRLLAEQLGIKGMKQMGYRALLGKTFLVPLEEDIFHSSEAKPEFMPWDGKGWEHSGPSSTEFPIPSFIEVFRIRFKSVGT